MADLRRCERATLIGLAVLMASRVLCAQASSTPSASDIKAAYLYQFGQYIESPPRPAGFAVCVTGDNAVATALEKLARQDAAAEKTVVRRDAGPAGACGILFVGHDEPRGQALVKAVAGGPTLVVGEDAAFLRAGGMVAFILKDRRVRFSVNLANAQAAHLKLSSQLLQHAAEVIE